MAARRFLRLSTWVVALTILLGRTAQAFDANLFTPAVDPQGYFSLYSAKTAPAKRFYLAVWYGYSDDTLQGYTTGSVVAARQKALVADQIHTLDVMGSYSLTNWLELGLDIPVSYMSTPLQQLDDGWDIDDVRLNAKLQLRDPGSAGVGFALVPFVEFASGDQDHLVSNGKTNFGLMGVTEFVARRFRGSLNVGYRANNKPFSGDDESDEILFGLGLGYLVLGEQPILGAETNRLELLGEIYGSTAEQKPFDDKFTTPLEFLAGGRFYHRSGLQFALGGGRKVYESVNGVQEWRIVASIGYSRQPPPVPPAPAPPPPPPMEKVVVTEEQIITLEPIYFDFDKASIKAVSYPVLDQVVKVMNDRPALRIRVEGHTDSKGTDAYNQRLSERRAASVVKYLQSKGIAAARLENAGFGESRPIAPNQNPDGSDNPVGRAKNRRTEFHVIQ